jgi:hypothetical protein
MKKNKLKYGQKYNRKKQLHRMSVGLTPTALLEQKNINLCATRRTPKRFKHPPGTEHKVLLLANLYKVWREATAKPYSSCAKMKKETVKHWAKVSTVV